MQLPVFLKHGEAAPLEHHENHLLLASNGLYRQRSNPVFDSSVRIEPADLELASHHEYCRLKCGRINRVMHRAMLSFFRSAQRLHGGEAALVLLYDPERRRYRWHCPVQSVQIRWSIDRWIPSDDIVFRNPQVLPEGYLHFGDAHLHAGSLSVPSLTDINDDQDGLHLIVADIDQVPSYHIAFVMDGKRFRVAPKLIFEDPDTLPGDRPPRGWLKRIDIRISTPATWQNTYTTYDPPGGNGRARR